ncbi:competence type IV pilus minor pilin ComGF [Bacillus sp. REN3]|uniref:competence type IV pilus minor pilin ComGF n=1 Tax=Bacillus sp. REN3 TaxID=2802440 RepID=UPI001AED8A7B|nr:competence type IV pilus minor pilin ComGF [Bacillus sp. REN3]
MKATIKRTAKNALMLNERGFTMLEMITSLATMLVIATIFPMGIKLFLADGIYEQGLWRMEWELFSIQAKKEIQNAETVSVQADRIVLQGDGKTVLYEKYGNSIRRRVDNEGHEILLQNISSLKLGEFEGGVEIFAVHLSGSGRSLRIQYFIQK